VRIGEQVNDQFETCTYLSDEINHSK